MDTKKCTQCDTVKPLAEFSKNKTRKDGYQSQCKGCVKRYKEENKVTLAEYHKRYREENKLTMADYQKRYNEENREAVADYQKLYREENKVAIAEQTKRYYKENKPAIAERNKRYNEENKKALMERKKHYQKERRATDHLFRLTCNIRGLIRNSFRNGGFNKKSKTAEILGCTFKEYYKHIEAQFTDGMSWQRMGEIHIDHRLPLSAANTEEEILVLNHYRNLQPLWATDNLAKSDSYCPDELAAYFKNYLTT